MKSSLTDQNQRALCLAFRNGKRCRRLATVIVVPPRHEGKTRCKECSEGLEVVRSSKKGFIVREGGFPPSREYHPIS